jgi:predicted RNA binding protein YcfA (HicA-like mRNA interferase family)
MPTKVKDIIKQLERAGWYLVRQTGSHRQFRHPARSGTVTVSGKLSADLAAGTESSIRRNAGLK